MKTPMIAALGAAAFVVAAPSAQARVAPQDLPDGSYRDSCSDTYVRDNRLYGVCETTRGDDRRTVLELSRCLGVPVANVDGVLVCGFVRGVDQGDGSRRDDDRDRDRDRDRYGSRNDRDDDRYGRPPAWLGGGSTNASIVLYRDENYRGFSTTLTSESPSLRLQGQNDAISSIRVNSGRWEVCEDSNFRGRCETISRDSSNLRDLEMNDMISSVRPARGGRR